MNAQTWFLLFARELVRQLTALMVSGNKETAEAMLERFKTIFTDVTVQTVCVAGDIFGKNVVMEYVFKNFQCSVVVNSTTITLTYQEFSIQQGYGLKQSLTVDIDMLNMNIEPVEWL